MRLMYWADVNGFNAAELLPAPCEAAALLSY